MEIDKELLSTQATEWARKYLDLNFEFRKYQLEAIVMIVSRVLENVKTAREGMMVFGWYEIQGKWYYFTADGSMLENSVTPDGYFVGSDGAWIQQ